MKNEDNKILIDFDERLLLPAFRDIVDNMSVDVFVLMGGAGSGKSTFMAILYLYYALTLPYFRGLYCRKIGRTIRNSQFRLFKDLIEKFNFGSLFRIMESTMEIECIINKNLIIASGIDNPEKIKSITDINAVWMEEASEFNSTDFEQLMLRMRKQDVKSQIFLTFNPVPCWIFDYFYITGEGEIDGDMKRKNSKKFNYEYKLIKTNYSDNYFLPEDYINKLKALKESNESMYRIYAEGKPALYFSDEVFHFNKDYFISNQVFQGDAKVYGVDFGYTNPTAVIEVNIDFKNKNIYVRELFYQSNVTNSELIGVLKQIINKGSYVFCDSAEPQRIKEIQRAGIKALTCNKDVVYGLNILKEYKLNITPDSPNLLKEMRSYSYAKGQKGNKTELPVKLFDHSIDALRYAVTGIHDLTKQKSTIDIIKYKSNERNKI